MTLEKEVIKNNQSSKYKKEVYKAIQKLPNKTIIPNGKKITAIKMIPTETFYIELQKKEQLNIPEKAEIINKGYENALEFKYKDLKYFVSYDS